jgi:hypothetical protein
VKVKNNTLINTMFPRKGGPKGATGPPSVHLPQHIFAMFENNKEIPFWSVSHSGGHGRNHKRRNKFTGVGSLLKPPPTLTHTTTTTTDDTNSPFYYTPPSILSSPMIPVTEHQQGILHQQKISQGLEKIQIRLGQWNPHSENDARKTENSYTTLFVGRLAPSITDEHLQEFMSQFGMVKMTRVVYDPMDGSSKQYGFVEFADELALQKAFREADGVELHGQPIVVDVERGRTVSSWIPRRFGGGLGGYVKKRGMVKARGRGNPIPAPDSTTILTNNKNRFGGNGRGKNYQDQQQQQPSKRFKIQSS